MLRGTYPIRRPLQEQTLTTLLSQCLTPPRCLGASSRRNATSLHSSRPRARTSFTPSTIPLTVRAFSGNANDRPASIAVLGGGITGLTAAYDLSRSHPDIPITLFESSPRVGGWVSSVKVPVEKGTVIFESGPRNLRPATVNGMLTLQLAKTLGLEDEIQITPKSSAAAKNRYIYYPDHLVKMPGPGQDLYERLWSLMTEPAFKGWFRGVAGEVGREPRRDKFKDESIGDFLARRLGSKQVGDNLASAVYHGIYAGDIYQLSAQSLMPGLHAQEVMYGSLVRGGAEGMLLARRKYGSGRAMFMQTDEARILRNLSQNLRTLARVEEMQKASVYSFRGGLQTFTDRLEKEFRLAPGKNTRIRTNVKIKNMSPDKKTGGVKIATCDTQPAQTYSHVVSTLPTKVLRNILVPNTPEVDHDIASTITALNDIPNATVMVINLYYPDTSLPIEGFGYLIPRSVPFEQNPEFALGVVFDSDATNLDLNRAGEPAYIGKKLTVIMGGHYWSHLTPDQLPTKGEALEMAKSVVRRHLKIEEEPEAHNVTLQADCIPQYTVGHEARLATIDRGLENVFGGRVTVAGAWTGGVGVNDCVQAGRKAAILVGGHGGGTGLAWAGREKKWVWADAAGQVVAEATPLEGI